MMKKALKIAALVLVCLVCGVFAAAMIAGNSLLNKISYEEAPEQTPEPAQIRQAAEQEGIVLPEESAPPEADDIVNLLLLGTDIKIPDSQDQGRSDCTMICSINKTEGSVTLISIERGIRVPVPSAYARWDGSCSDLITNVHAYLGDDYMLSIVEQCFNLELAGYAQVDFNTFQNVVDAIGGVDIELTSKEAEALNGYIYTNAKATHHMTEGLNHLDGYDALQYCRLRYTDSDWVRIDRQKNCIEACLKGIKGLSLKELYSLAEEVLPYIRTSLTKQEITELLLCGPKILENMELTKMTVPDYNWEGGFIKCDFDYESKKIANAIYGAGYEIESPY